MTGTRARALVLAGLVVGAALMLFAGGREWFHGRAVTDGLPALPVHVSGRDVAPIVSAIGLLALAAAGVTLFVGTALRRVVAVVVLVGGIAAVWRCVDVLLHQGSSASAVVRREVEAATSGTTTAVEMSAWPWIALAGSVLVVAAAVLLLVTVGSWPRASRRYEEDAATPAEPAAPEGGRPPADLPSDERSDAMWKALDRGEDPTD